MAAQSPRRTVYLQSPMRRSRQASPSACARSKPRNACDLLLDALPLRYRSRQSFGQLSGGVQTTVSQEILFSSGSQDDQIEGHTPRLRRGGAAPLDGAGVLD